MYDEKVYIYVRFGLKGFEHMSEYICVLCKNLSEKECDCWWCLCMSAESCVNVSTYINTFVKIQVQVIADVCGATLEIELTPLEASLLQALLFLVYNSSSGDDDL